MSKKIIDFNHISKSLTEDQMLELKSYYTTYHRKLWIFKRAYKRYKRFKYLGNSLSIIFSVGGIGGAIGSGGISLVVISTLALLIQGWMKHKNLDWNIGMCKYSYQSYEHLLYDIRDAMRLGSYNPNELISKINQIDDTVTDLCPVISNKLQKEYDKIFSS